MCYCKSTSDKLISQQDQADRRQNHGRSCAAPLRRWAPICRSYVPGFARSAVALFSLEIASDQCFDAEVIALQATLEAEVAQHRKARVQLLHNLAMPCAMHGHVETVDTQDRDEARNTMASAAALRKKELW